MKKFIGFLATAICAASLGVIKAHSDDTISQTEVVNHVEKSWDKNGNVKYWAYTRHDSQNPVETGYDTKEGDEILVNRHVKFEYIELTFVIMVISGLAAIFLIGDFADKPGIWP